MITGVLIGFGTFVAVVGSVVLVFYGLPRKPSTEPFSPVGRCITCKFNDQGACKRYPPERVYTGDTRENKAALDVTVWPVVNDTNWCGEWKDKK